MNVVDLQVSPRDDIPTLQLDAHRELQDNFCPAEWTCEGFVGFDGRVVNKQRFIFKFFGIGCVTKCIPTFFLTLYLEFLGWDCGACL